MYFDKKVLAVVPARGGSKGLVGKNIKNLRGKPLITWTLELANQCDLIDKVVVSTDDAKIASIAAKAGAEVPFIRPSELATDTASTKDVLLHCIKSLEEQFDILVVLQPTTPLRTNTTLVKSIKLCAEKNKSVVSISENTKPVEWMFYKEGDGIEYVIEQEDKPMRRQDCKPVYYVNGSVYCIPIVQFMSGSELFDKSSLTVISPHNESVDIDTLKDFEYCNFLLGNK